MRTEAPYDSALDGSQNKLKKSQRQAQRSQKCSNFFKGLCAKHGAWLKFKRVNAKLGAALALKRSQKDSISRDTALQALAELVADRTNRPLQSPAILKLERQIIFFRSQNNPLIIQRYKKVEKVDQRQNKNKN